MNKREQELLERVDSLRDWLVQSLQELVRIPTVNPYSGDESAANEAAGQEWIADRFGELGGRVRRVRVPEDVYSLGRVIGPAGRSWQGRENVVAQWGLGKASGPAVLLNTHMDTVGTAGMELEPFNPVIKEGKIYGRGTSDSKGNMVMGLTAMSALLECRDDLEGQIVFESVVDEECNGGGAGTLACCLAGVTADFAIVMDGSKGEIVNGCNGIATARVVVYGRAGHSAFTTSLSAIDKGIEVKQAIDALAAEHRKTFPSCAVNIGVFRSGTLPAIVPGEAELQINLSYDIADAREAERRFGCWDGRMFRARFEDAMRALGERDEWFCEKPVRVEWIKDIYPFQVVPDNRFVRVAVEAAGEIARRPPNVRSMPAWFDGAHIARRLGIPIIGMGYGAAGVAHSSCEYVVIDDLMEGAKAIALTLYRLCRGSG